MTPSATSRGPPDSDEGSHTGYFPGGALRLHQDVRRARGVPRQDASRSSSRASTATRWSSSTASSPRSDRTATPNFDVKADPYPPLRGSRTRSACRRARTRTRRWYTGAGIHRDTQLSSADLVHVALDGVRITTPDVDAERAVVAIATTVENDTRATRTVRVDTRDPRRRRRGGRERLGARDAAARHERGRARCGSTSRSPALWSPDAPDLYTAQTTVTDDDDDARRGAHELRHPDAAARPAARPAHQRRDGRPARRLHPPRQRPARVRRRSRAPRSAASRCSRRRASTRSAARTTRSARPCSTRATALGMLVMDETFDMWTEPKAPFDYSLAFPEWWERDVEAMVAKDFNHPSVIMYSIGNEIFETGTPDRLDLGPQARREGPLARRHALRHQRHQPPGRPSPDRLGELMGDVRRAGGRRQHDDRRDRATLMQQISASDVVTRATEESAAVLDVVRHQLRATRATSSTASSFPTGSSSAPRPSPRTSTSSGGWSRTNPHVIGDFTWTGWDYLGEAGIGRVDYPDEPTTCATGDRGALPVAHRLGRRHRHHRPPPAHVLLPRDRLRAAARALHRRPPPAVPRPPDRARRRGRGRDTVSSWSWDVPDGSPATVDVYSDADEVELLLNGRSLGRAAVGRREAVPRPLRDRPTSRASWSRSPHAADEEQARTRAADGRRPAPPRRDRRPQPRSAPTTPTSPTSRSRSQDADGNLATHHDRLVSVERRRSRRACRPRIGRSPHRRALRRLRVHDLRRPRARHRPPDGTGEIEIRVSADGCETVTATVTATQPPSDATPTTD